MKVSFIFLSAFSSTGGIEKFNRSFIKACSDLEKEKVIKRSFFYSFYDSFPDPNYTQGAYYAAFNRRYLSFIFSAIFGRVVKSDIVFLGHINLAPLGLILKFFYPTKKIVLITHGIEVWGRLSVFKKLILKFTYKVFTVSNYTKGILCNEHRLKPHKVELFPNAIDPFFLIPTLTASKSSSKFNLNAETKVLLTLSRLSFFERNKGYDVIIELMPELLLIEPNLKYIIAGKYDDLEGIRLKEKIADLKLTEKVILTGFVKEEELTEFYSACDIFVIPSKKEGFGIVFIEALVCGLQVIGGNKDGTVDALQNGLFGILVDPDCKESIKEGIIKALSKNTSKQDKLYLQSQVLEKFGYLKFKERLAIQINQMVNA